MSKYINRKQYINKLLSYKDKDLIKVITGLRRSGKSTLFDLYREQLYKLGIGKRQVQFYNFELPENYLNKNWDDIYFEIKNKLQVDKTNYIFLDEVQNIEGWHLFVNRLQRKQHLVFLSSIRLRQD